MAWDACRRRSGHSQTPSSAREGGGRRFSLKNLLVRKSRPKAPEKDTAKAPEKDEALTPDTDTAEVPEKDTEPAPDKLPLVMPLLPATLPPPLQSRGSDSRRSRITAPLEVRVTVRFLDPVIRSVYSRTYESSSALDVTDRLCRGLLRRIQHCSEELITRKDSGALSPAPQCQNKPPKDARFEMDFQVYRKDVGLWSQRTYTSFQKQPLTSETVKEVVRSTHRMIGLFLRRHDAGFRWTDEPVPEYFSEKPATFRPSLEGHLSLCCVPRGRFIESSQSWEFIPGYAVELTMSSHSQFRKEHPDFRKTLRLSSSQSTPLTLALGEELIWQAYRFVQDSLDSRKHLLDMEHRRCDHDPEVTFDCQHFDDYAVEIGLRIVNNLGPAYEHLCRSLRTDLRLFRYPDCADCDEFFEESQVQFSRLRDEVDGQLAKLEDFDFRILDLKGRGWEAHNPARFVLDGPVFYSRRIVEAILDRIQTGVTDVLRGNGVTIHMVAYKRGHLILDKALVARESKAIAAQEGGETPESQKAFFISKLRERIQRDLDLISRDTCYIEDIPDEPLVEPNGPVGVVSSKPEVDTVSREGSPAVLEVSTPTTPTTPTGRVFPLVPSKYRLSSDSIVLANGSSGDLVAALPTAVAVPVPISAPALEETLIRAVDEPEVVVVDEPVLVAVDEAPCVEPTVVVAPQLDDAKELSSEIATTPEEVASLPEEPSFEVETAPTEVIREPEQAHEPSPETIDATENVNAESDDLQEPVSELATAPQEVASVIDSSREPPSEMATALEVASPGPDEAQEASSVTLIVPEEVVPVPESMEEPLVETAVAPVNTISEPKDTQEPLTEKAPAPEEVTSEQENAQVLLESPELQPQSDSLSLRSGDGAESSRPSTPGLSSGGDASPDASLLITPTFVRTMPGSQEPAMRYSDLTLELGTPGPSTDGHLGVVLGKMKAAFEPCLPDGTYPTPPESEVASVDMETAEVLNEPESSDVTEVATPVVQIGAEEEKSPVEAEASEDVPEETEHEPSMPELPVVSETDAVVATHADDRSVEASLSVEKEEPSMPILAEVQETDSVEGPSVDEQPIEASPEVEREPSIRELAVIPETAPVEVDDADEHPVDDSHVSPPPLPSELDNDIPIPVSVEEDIPEALHDAEQLLEAEAVLSDLGDNAIADEDIGEAEILEASAVLLSPVTPSLSEATGDVSPSDSGASYTEEGLPAEHLEETPSVGVSTEDISALESEIPSQTDNIASEQHEETPAAEGALEEVSALDSAIPFTEEVNAVEHYEETPVPEVPLESVPALDSATSPETGDVVVQDPEETPAAEMSLEEELEIPEDAQSPSEVVAVSEPVESADPRLYVEELSRSKVDYFEDEDEALEPQTLPPSSTEENEAVPVHADSETPILASALPAESVPELSQLLSSELVEKPKSDEMENIPEPDQMVETESETPTLTSALSSESVPGSPSSVSTEEPNPDELEDGLELDQTVEAEPEPNAVSGSVQDSEAPESAEPAQSTADEVGDIPELSQTEEVEAEPTEVQESIRDSDDQAEPAQSATDELENTPEVQSSADTEPEPDSELSDRVELSQSTADELLPALEPNRSVEVEPELDGVQEPAPSAVDELSPSPSESQVPEVAIVELEPVVTKDSSALPTADDSPVSEPLQQPSEIQPTPALAEKPSIQSLAARRSPYLLPPLQVSSSHTSISSEWEDYDSNAARTSTSKDSVDTILLQDESVPPPTTRPAVPQRLSTATAGYLGLHETRLVEMGLRGALVGSHRFDAPRPATATSDLTVRPGTPLSPSSDAAAAPRPAKASVRIHHHRRTRSAGFKAMLKAPRSSLKLRKKGGEVSGEVTTTTTKDASGHEDGAKEAVEEGGASRALPRVMMLFGGLALASQIMTKSS
ncbi:Pt repeat family protein [Pleurostoma richardsiae]|uniref:Pt repeat family protein n=1 Tax=Pleurostoma richardsiae TaxID=41990 RepID=A0AA38R6Z0_9PEZI|nr:Pt repeat family protein [Pleurostoma richardsiae]